MNARLVLLLSMLGLAMAFGTVFFIASNIAPFAWLAIFLVCAWLIATRAGSKPFRHGLAVGLLNSVWVTSAHILLFRQYAASHPEEMEAMRSMPLAESPRLMMAITGPIIGLVTGVVLGVLALGATKLVSRRPASPSPAN